MLKVSPLKNDPLRRRRTDDEIVGSVGDGGGRCYGEGDLAAGQEVKVKHKVAEIKTR